MITERASSKQAGFAIVLTLVLLSLLVMIALAVSSVNRIQTSMADGNFYQTQARQNALLGMRAGMAKLQDAAGSDARITGMSGVTGIEAHRDNSTRHWCGVWTTAGTFLGWMVSGAKNTGAPELASGVEAIELWGYNSMGGLAADSERIIAGKLVINTTGSEVANYAYAITDEGVKIPIQVPDPVLTEAPQIFNAVTDSKNNVRKRMRDAISSNATAVDSMLCYEQMSLLVDVSGATLQDNLHHVTLASRYPEGGQLRGGKVNINTNSKRVWQGLLQTYNLQVPDDEQLSNDRIRLRGEDLGKFAAEFEIGGMKLPFGPFLNTDAVVPFLLSELDGDNGEANGSEIMDILRPMLTTRSDTFRIRAYGDAMNPVDADDPNAKPESVAYCEAIVQRTTDSGPGGVGKKFVITYFRWLGPDDI